MIELTEQEKKDELLNVAKYVVEKLDANNIPYVIYYGTLLGAIRHDGFIPWDDDFDLIIPSNYLNVLSDIFDDDGFEFWSNKNINYYDWVPRVSSNETLVSVNNSPWPVYNHTFSTNTLGLAVDIYPVLVEPDSKVLRFLQGILGKIEKKLYSSSFRLKSDKIKKAANMIYAIRSNMKGDVYYFENHLRQRRKNRLFSNRKKVDFCGISVYVPENPELELQEIYGNWRKIPSQSEIDSAVHYEKVYKR